MTCILFIKGELGSIMGEAKMVRRGVGMWGWNRRGGMYMEMMRCRERSGVKNIMGNVARTLAVLMTWCVTRKKMDVCAC